MGGGGIEVEGEELFTASDVNNLDIVPRENANLNNFFLMKKLDHT